MFLFNPVKKKYSVINNAENESYEVLCREQNGEELAKYVSVGNCVWSIAPSKIITFLPLICSRSFTDLFLSFFAPIKTNLNPG